MLAFDFGLSRIGVAVGQTTTRTATALETISNKSDQAAGRIAALIREWRPAALVVGLPLAADGAETEMSGKARRFAAELANSTGLEVYFEDERLTSSAVESDFAAMRAAGARRRKDAAMKDAMAARIILENWLQSHPGN